MLKIKPHSIKTEKGDIIELLTAVECKGIIGNDGRHYLLDLLRMMPPDLNYLPGLSSFIFHALHYSTLFSRSGASFAIDETTRLSQDVQASAVLFETRIDRRLHRVSDHESP